MPRPGKSEHAVVHVFDLHKFPRGHVHRCVRVRVRACARALARVRGPREVRALAFALACARVRAQAWAHQPGCASAARGAAIRSQLRARIVTRDKRTVESAAEAGPHRLIDRSIDGQDGSTDR